MMNDELKAEERDLLTSFEKGEWQSVADAKLLNRYRQAARNTARKDKRVNIRISSQDLELLQARAWCGRSGLHPRRAVPGLAAMVR